MDPSKVTCKFLVPTVGARVGVEGNAEAGTVFDVSEHDETGAVAVRWNTSLKMQAVYVHKLVPRFEPIMEVLEVPRSTGRLSLGEGYVITSRQIGGLWQILVHFRATGEIKWVPWQNLRTVPGVANQFAAKKFEGSSAAERFRLRALARAIVQWNANTGALTRMAIDPLPHQINLVHHILASGNLNWLIADDVGLGKTIEVGMLLSALNTRKQARRVLLVTPAGLVRQWQEELANRFGLNDFWLYGEDFRIERTEHWKQHDRVIASLDRLKSSEHLESIMQADHWDLIVFDEAHRLTRSQSGMRYSASDRFTLAVSLRERTESMLLLSATPHQGRHDRFKSLLHLLRPELSDSLERIDREPEILADMVFRNRKDSVRYMDGSLVFKGKVVRRIEVSRTEREQAFEKSLQNYFKKGYAVSERERGQRKAIGFVMTMYRKLAASSLDAIRSALERRLERLSSEFKAQDAKGTEADDRFEGESDEVELGRIDGEQEFFIGESAMLTALIEEARQLAIEDSKLDAFLKLAADEIGKPATGGRIVVFTEYRATQDLLARRLRVLYGEESVALIHGGQHFHEREAAIREFETTARFLVSTEAGGEGLNMQRRCHVMVNYDLPWNPMRLVQRIGRLYRYGQSETVVVLNMSAKQSVDDRVIDVMYERLDQVVTDLSGVSEDFAAGMQTEWLGDVVELLDVRDVMDKAIELGESRTGAVIDEAIQQAAEATKRQRELFEHVSGFDPKELDGQLRINAQHLQRFVLGMCRLLGIGIERPRGLTSVWRLKLNDALRRAVGHDQVNMLIAFDRNTVTEVRDIELIDMDSPLLRWLLEESVLPEFGGRTSLINDMDGKAVMIAMLRWQDDSGRRRREEFAVVGIDKSGKCTSNPPAFVDWLLAEQDETDLDVPDVNASECLSLAYHHYNDHLGERSTAYMHPETIELLSAAAVSG